MISLPTALQTSPTAKKEQTGSDLDCRVWLEHTFEIPPNDPAVKAIIELLFLLSSSAIFSSEYQAEEEETAAPTENI